MADPTAAYVDQLAGQLRTRRPDLLDAAEGAPPAVKALTIRQPWADAIAHQTKRIENRTWKTNYRGLILIHAAAAHDPKAAIYGPRPDTRSAVIAIAEIDDCHYSDDGECCGPWGDENVYHWHLTEVRTLEEPVPYKGRLGLWTPDKELLAAVNKQRTVFHG